MLCEHYNESGLANPAVIVDTNHANSGKKWEEQTRIAKEILHSTRHSPDIYKLVKGLMIESYIEDRRAKKPDGRKVTGQIHHGPVHRSGKDGRSSCSRSPPCE